MSSMYFEMHKKLVWIGGQIQAWMYGWMDGWINTQESKNSKMLNVDVRLWVMKVSCKNLSIIVYA